MAGMEYDFTANVAPFVAALEAAIGAAKEFEHAIEGARDAEAELGAAGAEAAGGLTAQAAAMEAAAVSADHLRDTQGKFLNSVAAMRRETEKIGDTFRRQSETGDEAARAMRDLEADSRKLGLTASEAGTAAAAGMHDYRKSLDDLSKTVADAERGISDLQTASVAKAGGQNRSLLKGLLLAGGRDLENGVRDAEKGINDLENAASDATTGGGGLSKLMGMLGPVGMPALITGAAGAIAGAVPAVLSLGGGFAAFAGLAAPALYKVKQGLSNVTYAQQQYQQAKATEKQDPTAANLKAEQRALTTLKATWAAMPAPVRGAVSEIRQFGKAWSQASRRSGIQRDALGDIKLALKDARDLIPTVTSLARHAAPVIHGMLGDLGKEFKSKGFKDFIHTLNTEMGPAAHAMKTIGGAVGGFITQLTKREAKPGTQMLENIGKFLKTITPGMVTGLTGITKGISGFFAGLTKIASSKAMSTAVSMIKSDVSAVVQTIARAKQFVTDLGNHASFSKLWNDWWGSTGKKAATEKVPVKVTPQIIAAKEHEKNLLAAMGFTGGKFGGKAGEPTVTYHVKAKVDSGSLAKSLDSSQQLKAGAAAATVKVKPKVDSGDVKRQIADAARTGGNIPVKGRVTLTGLAAGIKSQIASLHIPDSQVHIAVSVTGVGSARAAMASVVGAARKDAASAAAALNSLGAAGAAAGRALDQGLAGGILAGESSVVAAAASVAGAAAAAARKAAGIASPSKVWQGIGRQMIQGLLLGLQGGKAQVQAAARAISGAAAPFKDASITATVRKLREDVIKAFKAGDITRHQRDGLVDFIDNSNRRLMRLAQQRAKIMGEIKAATALAHSVTQAAIGSADITAIAGNVLAQQNKGNPGMTIQQGQQQQLSKIKQFTHAIAQLKREGLDKTSIKQLLAAGVSGGLPAAQRLLSEGPKAVRESARLQQEIIKASKRLGITGANAAYESASQMGKGLAQGLRDQLKPIVAAMRDIARALIATLAKELGLKPGQSLKNLFGGLGGGGGTGGGGGGGGHHRHRMHHGPGGMQMSPGGPHGLIHGGGPPMMMHPGMRAQPIHVHVHQHTVVHIGGMQAGAALQQVQLRHARRNIATGVQLAGRGV